VRAQLALSSLRRNADSNARAGAAWIRASRPPAPLTAPSRLLGAATTRGCARPQPRRPETDAPCRAAPELGQAPEVGRGGGAAPPKGEGGGAGPSRVAAW